METTQTIKLAVDGDISAQYNLGVMYANGVGVHRDMREAVKWWNKAAENNHLYAQYNLGHCYAEGDLGQPDGEEAVKWMTQAAEGGLVEAQFAMGLILQSGKLVVQDIGQAIHWYQKAGEQGNKEALFNLGNIFTEDDKRKDPVKAFTLFSLAKAMGDENAAARLQELSRTMTDDQMQKGASAVANMLGNARKVDPE